MLAAFELYGTHHIATLSTLCALGLLFIYICRKHPRTLPAKLVVTTLAFLCLAAYPLEQLAWQLTGSSHSSLEAAIPFHLCDITALLCGFALITRKPILCELSYYCGLAGTMQGLLTPNLAITFPNPQFITFFILHGSIVITALLLPIGLGWKPRPGSVRRAFTALLIYATAAGLLNLAIGTNFGYLSHKPLGATLLDIMGPWPYYIICLISVSGVLFALLSLPFRGKVLKGDKG